jgi:pyruvate ferredoxin oxidoreductase beta subunit
MPCHLGWGFKPEETIELSRLAVKTGLFPLVEYENHVLSRVMKLKDIVPVEAYLSKQERFAHLFSKENRNIIGQIQELADRNIVKYGLRI